MDSHLYALSNKSPDFESDTPLNRVGQKERYYIVSVPPTMKVSGNEYAVKWVAGKFDDTFGKRTLIFTGNYTEVSIPYLEGGKLNIFGDSEVDGLLTWQVIGVNALLRYISLGNPAMPLTQKVISDISFSGNRVNVEILSDLVRGGSMVLLSDYANQGLATCYRSVLASFYWYNSFPGSLLSYPEDIEFSILYTEDLMDKENRDFLYAFRGKVANKKTIATMKDLFKKYKLDDYVSRNWIVAYDSLDFWVDTQSGDNTLIRGYYRYRPIYPINKIWIEHSFVV